MKRLKGIVSILFLALSTTLVAQEQEWGQKFEQLGPMLPTGNVYRTASGAPGPQYWQQKADYKISVTLDDEKQTLTGSETITYYNQSPDVLEYLWVQLDQNLRSEGSDEKLASSSSIPNDSLYSLVFRRVASDYEGGYNIAKVVDGSGNGLDYTINKTMMRIDLPAALKNGESFKFSIDWSYNINDRKEDSGRSGFEYFSEDGNYLYTIAQFYPRMAVYNDVEGWQNKQFLGDGEFALTFGDFEVDITVPADHVVASTGTLENAQDVLSKDELKRFEKAKTTFDKPVIIVTEDEAKKKEKSRSKETKTWKYKADNVRDFAFATSRKFIWDAMAVKVGDNTPLAMSYYPKEGNPMWEEHSTIAVKNTLDTYSRLTIDYPYPIAISVHAANIGMEYPMICFNYGRPNPDGTYSQRLLQGMLGVIVHEVGHNYFPMIINSDERQWTWMDEGLNSFLENVTMMEHYPQFEYISGTPKGITNYMKGDKSYIRPIMTNSEQIRQFGNNAYNKPSAALFVLRETIMGPELFDKAFKTYAERWAFKHPTPADFFRTMEDASAVDLDWFWRGWFYSIDYVDVEVTNVKWFQVSETTASLEGQTQTGRIESPVNLDSDGNYSDFSNGPSPLTITDSDPRFLGEYRSNVNDDEIRAKMEGKNIYEVTLTNKGGLVTPVLIEWTFADGSKEMQKIPAEIWRYNEKTVKKVFIKEKEVTKMVIDPEEATADAETFDNVFPKQAKETKFDQFKSDGN